MTDMAAPLLKSFVQVVRCFRTSLRTRLLFTRRGKHTVQNLTAVLKDSSLTESGISVKGWVKSVREHKDHVFLHVTDGSGPRPLQIVTTPQKLRTSGVTYGSCVAVEGRLVTSPGKSQSVEVVADQIILLGTCDSSFPFGARHKHSPDFTRNFLHLRPRTDSFASLIRLRSAATFLFHSYFQKQGYLLVHTPIVTSSDCEGAGEVFEVQVPQTEDAESASADNQSENGEKAKLFFNCPAFLTVSGQLHLEAVASGFSKVYCFGPAFRAENSRGRHHLSEFYMLEAEVAFISQLEELIQIMEEMVRAVCWSVIDCHGEELQFYTNCQGLQPHQEQVASALRKPFPRITYTEAVRLLQKSNSQFQHKVKWGCDLKKEHEKFLTSHHGNVPVFVTDFPACLKPFYAKANPDGQTVAAVDMLVPGVGELIGGSLREDSLDRLTNRLQRLNMLHQYTWYTDLRRYGSSPHGGFGLGFERFLQFLLGTPNIRDTLPFPRWSRNCQF